MDSTTKIGVPTAQDEKIYIRGLIRFFWRKGFSSYQALEEICAVEGKKAVSQGNIIKWYQRFRAGDLTLDDRPRSGRPEKVDYESLRRSIEENPKISIRKLSKACKTSATTAHRTLRKVRRQKLNLNKKKPGEAAASSEVKEDKDAGADESSSSAPALPAKKKSKSKKKKVAADESSTGDSKKGGDGKSQPPVETSDNPQPQNNETDGISFVVEPLAGAQAKPSENSQHAPSDMATEPGTTQPQHFELQFNELVGLSTSRTFECTNSYYMCL